MDKFWIFGTRQFLENLDKKLKHRKRQIQNKLNTYVYPQLRHQPFWGKNIKKLRGYHPETWRYRIGPYRFFYAIHDGKKKVSMLTIDSREDAY